MVVLSGDETKAHYQEKMGDELGLIFYAIICEFSALSEKWADYLTLYGTNESRVSLLNNAAPTFFGRIQNVMWGDILLSLARLTDPPETGPFRRTNLTLKALPRFLGDSCLELSVAAVLADIDVKAKFCRDWRN